MMDLNNRSVLFKVAEEVIKDEHINNIINFMWKIMYRNNGIGLAAPQIGISKRIIIMDTANLSFTMINPIITKRRLGKVKSKEGCLSFPGLERNIQRDKQIVVEAFDQNWNPIKYKLRGLEGFVVQHEIDHLNGITIRNA